MEDNASEPRPHAPQEVVGLVAMPIGATSTTKLKLDLGIQIGEEAAYG